uniref:Ig-like domain-containing protein n=1 Tax=Lepisosteus oculatus TaxID=7918 RepID=W5MGA5_LEPOC
DSITSQEADLSGNEGDLVTLTCSYDSSSNNIYIYWFRQSSDQPLQYILQKGARSYSSIYTADFAKRRFSSTAERYSTTLTITGLTLEDTAIYYCALWNPESHAHKTRHTMCINKGAGTSSAEHTASFAKEQVSQTPFVTQTEGQAVTIHCTFTISNVFYMHWYRQQPNTSPQNVLIIRGDKSTENQFSGSLEKNNSSGVLNISSSQLEDSGTYFCETKFGGFKHITLQELK